MNYQQVLAISYVFNLMNQLINSHIYINQNINVYNYEPMPAPAPAPADINKYNNKKIIKLENTFYIQDSKKNLYLIQNNMNRSDNNIKILLDTFILFEENKMKPMDIYLKLRHNNSLRRIDYELLKTLQMQYVTDKSYFESYI
jgi:hypothetical protein